MKQFLLELAAILAGMAIAWLGCMIAWDGFGLREGAMAAAGVPILTFALLPSILAWGAR